MKQVIAFLGAVISLGFLFSGVVIAWDAMQVANPSYGSGSIIQFWLMVGILVVGGGLGVVKNISWLVEIDFQNYKKKPKEK